MSQQRLLAWEPENTAQELQPLLHALGEEYPIVAGPTREAILLEFESGGAGAVEVSLEDERARIVYDRPARAARAVGALLADLVPPGRAYKETLPFETFGVMVDCSRNAVMTVEYFKRWLRRLALLGFDTAMLYTEDTYELSGEDYFGYLRGRYSAGELRQIDLYAGELGIEMVGCIQTLGHLAQVLKWPAYSPVRDTNEVLLVDEEATYELIEKMIANFAGAFRSRRIHVGMDETHDLGRGRFMDRFGYERGYDIFNRHLARIVEICKRCNLEPMIWSDMYFRMGSKTGDYYDEQCRIPEDVKQQIPRDVRLVYWDYYHGDEEFYLDWIQRHRDLGCDPVVASGVWTWGGSFWYDRRTTEQNAAPCIRACRTAGVRELFFTMWGDGGEYCEWDSALAGLAYVAEVAYVGDDAGQDEQERLGRRFSAICGADYQAVIEVSGMRLCGAEAFLWDDPLLGIYWKDKQLRDPKYWEQAARDYRDSLRRLSNRAQQTEPVDFAHAANLLNCLLAKIEFRLELERTYSRRDPAGLEQVRQRIPQVIEAIDKTLGSFRRQWYRRNKPNGFEVIQIRLGGLKQRYLEVSERLGELATGKIEKIPELDECPSHPINLKTMWRNLASASAIL